VIGARLVAGAASAIAACGGPAKPAPPPEVSARPLTRIAAEEPEAESDEVQVIASKGHMDPRAVDAGIAPHRAALTACYTERVGRRRWLGGHALLRWEVAADGAIARVLLVSSDLGAWPVEKCLLEVARAAAFGKPIGGAAAELLLPLEFSAHGQPPVWDAEQSALAIGGQLTTLAACAKGAVPPCEVAITLYAGPRGRVESVGFASATTPIATSGSTGPCSNAQRCGESIASSGSAGPCSNAQRCGESIASSGSAGPCSNAQRCGDWIARSGSAGPRSNAQRCGDWIDDAWATCAEKTALAWHLPDPKGQVTKLAVRYRPR
jgi:hypothetical protein